MKTRAEQRRIGKRNCIAAHCIGRENKSIENGSILELYGGGERCCRALHSREVSVLRGSENKRRGEWG